MMHHHNSFLKQRWMTACLRLLVTSAVFLAAIPLQSQDKKQTKSADDDVIKVTSNLVNLDVIVKDKKGKAITDLRPDDFTVTENGVRQNIEFFDSALAAPEDAAKATVLANTTLSSQPSGFPRSIIALVLDEQTT